MMDGIEIVPSPLLAGCKRAVFDGRRLSVSPAFADLIKSAKTQKELVALIRSLRVVNIGPPRHDAQWHADTMQIKIAQMKDAFPDTFKSLKAY